MSDHSIPTDAMNSWVRFCADEFVRDEIHREILLRRWFESPKPTIEQLAEQYELSDRAIKDIIYDEGDPVLIKALELTKSNNYQKPSGY